MKKVKLIVKIVLSILALILVIAILVAFIAPRVVKKEKTEFTNDNLYCQTAIYDVVMNHFNNDNGKQKKALILGYDGTRRDTTDIMMANNGALRKIVDDGGVVYKSFAGGYKGNLQPTVTACGWTTILTGVLMDQHSVEGNGKLKSPEYRTFITKLAEEKGLNTAFFGTHPDIILQTLKEEAEYTEDNKIPAKFECCPKSNEITVDKNLQKKVKTQLAKTGEDSLDLVFAVYDGTDLFGHSPFGGFTEDRGAYAWAVKTVDKWGLDLIKTVENRETYENEDWLIMILSDHGGLKYDHWDQTKDERDVYIVSNKPFPDDLKFSGEEQ